MTATTLILSAISPWLVALLRRCTWPKELVEVLAFGCVALLYVAGQWFDGVLSYPLTQGFWAGLAAAVGVQQLSYKLLLRDTPVLTRLEDVGN